MGLGLGLGFEVHALARVLDGEGAREVLDVALGRRVLVRVRGRAGARASAWG